MPSALHEGEGAAAAPRTIPKTRGVVGGREAGFSVCLEARRLPDESMPETGLEERAPQEAWKPSHCSRAFPGAECACVGV